MRLGLRQLMRVTRLFLAVAMLWLATAPAAAPVFEAWSEAAAMIAAPAAREADAGSERVTLPARAIAAPSAELVSTPPRESPLPRASRRAALAPDLYLRNCALLC